MGNLEHKKGSWSRDRDPGAGTGILEHKKGSWNGDRDPGAGIFLGRIS